MAQLIAHRSVEIVSALLMCCAFAACAGAPVQEMSNARQAIRAAYDAGAERVAPQPLREARTYMERAEANLQDRDYRAARRKALAARSKAVEALDAAQSAARLPPSG